MIAQRFRALGAVATATVLLSTAIACSSSGSSDGKITLTIANSQWLDALRGKNLWAAVQEYEKTNGNVKLKQDAIPSKDFGSKITTQLGAGQGADVIIAQDGVFVTAAAGGSFVPLTSVVQKATGLNDTSDAGVVNGTQYGVAWQRAAYALVYNKTLLAQAGITEPPATVDELIAAAKAVKAKTGAVGLATRNSNADPSWYLDFENWLYGYGGGVFSADGKITVNTPQNVAAVTAFKKMYDAGILATGDDMTTSRTRFKAGKVAFVFDNSGGTLNMATGGSVPSKDVGVTPLPFANPGAHQQILVGVNKNSKNVRAATDFVTWLMSGAGQSALRNASGPDTLATDVAQTKSFVADNPWAPTFEEVAPKSKSLLVTGHETKTAAIFAPVMDAVESVVVSGADPATALAAAQGKAEAAAK
ncbi:ABC transporter substrate-binding protein [Nonomuraea sp. CA-143628]|uniref:ABC transporter substrate-binding protein n=1 Tax=Nonomuraea sp. CA-143628 TaxID=3239997 RepID=UPI003D8D2441